MKEDIRQALKYIINGGTSIITPYYSNNIYIKFIDRVFVLGHTHSVVETKDDIDVWEAIKIIKRELKYRDKQEIQKKKDKFEKDMLRARTMLELEKILRDSHLERPV
jgi:hypothetical protein